jgi:hypothetical protein
MDEDNGNAPAGEDTLESLLASLETKPHAADEPASDTGEPPALEDEAANGDDADASNDGDGEENKEDEGDAAPNKKLSGAQRAARKIERLEAELAELRERRPAPAAGDATALASAIEAEIGGPPDEKDFPDFLAFERALTAYETEKRIVARELKKEAAKSANVERERFVEVVEAHNERLDELEALLPGVKAKLAASDAQVARHVGELVIGSDKSALLQVHLATKPDELAKLNRMSPVQAAREIGRLEARLALPKPRTETRAPAPVRAPRGGATPTSHESEMNAWLSKQYGPRV